MKLSHHTDYALRLLIYLAVHTDRPATIQEVAEAYDVSAHHLAKVAQEMVHSNWVESSRGRGGGLRLAQKPAAISLGAVIRRTETSFALVECLGGESTCPIESACRLKGVLAEARDAFLAVIDRYTLADLVRQRRTLVPLLLHGDTADR